LAPMFDLPVARELHALGLGEERLERRPLHDVPYKTSSAAGRLAR
jgi:hypothetical protein